MPSSHLPSQDIGRHVSASQDGEKRPADLPAQVEEMLREMALVLHATRSIKRALTNERQASS